MSYGTTVLVMLEAQAKSWDMTVIHPRTKNKRKASMNRPTCMFQLLGVYSKGSGLCPLGL